MQHIDSTIPVTAFLDCTTLQSGLYTLQHRRHTTRVVRLNSIACTIRCPSQTTRYTSKRLLAHLQLVAVKQRLQRHVWAQQVLKVAPPPDAGHLPGGPTVHVALTPRVGRRPRPTGVPVVGRLRSKGCTQLESSTAIIAGMLCAGNRVLDGVTPQGATVKATVFRGTHAGSSASLRERWMHTRMCRQRLGICA